MKQYYFKKLSVTLALILIVSFGQTTNVLAASNSKNYSIPGNYGTLTSNCWRTTGIHISLDNWWKFLKNIQIK